MASSTQRLPKKPAKFRLRQGEPETAALQGAYVPLVRTSHVALEMQPRADQRADSTAD